MVKRCGCGAWEGRWLPTAMPMRVHAFEVEIGCATGMPGYHRPGVPFGNSAGESWPENSAGSLLARSPIAEVSGALKVWGVPSWNPGGKYLFEIFTGLILPDPLTNPADYFI